MCCVSVRSLCDCHDQIYDLPFGTLVVSHDPLAIQHPGNPGTNTCLENEKPPKTPIEIRDFSGKRPIFFPWSFMFSTNKIIPQSSPSFLRCGTLVDHSWVVWEGPHTSHGRRIFYPATCQIEVPIILRTRFCSRKLMVDFL